MNEIEKKAQDSIDYSADNIQVLEGLEAGQEKTRNVYRGYWGKGFASSCI